MADIFSNPDYRPEKFFVTGGTLQPDAPSYVVRSADEELFSCLSEGELCYVLDSRQMGKSSLMARTAARLNREGAKTVLVDLTAIGVNVTVDQWYFGLTAQITGQLWLGEELIEIWEHDRDMGPHQRWINALTTLIQQVDSRIVIFIDEIDTVRSLPFSTDEFFAGLREIYNRRGTSPSLKRLSFCLIGVAKPSDLISDPQRTPFNIGSSITLSDFTLSEASIFAAGLNYGRDAQRLLERVLYWTDGHPYLTQRLCRAISQDFSVTNDQEVDAVVNSLFLSEEGRWQGSNLVFIRDRLTEISKRDSAVIFEYLQILKKPRKGHASEQNSVRATLALTGIIKVAGGAVGVRNRIYAKVFDKKWASGLLPDAEQRRLRNAFWKGFIRATSVSSAVLTVVISLLLYAQSESERALEASQKAQEASQTAVAQQTRYEELFYDSSIGYAKTLIDADPPKLREASNQLDQLIKQLPSHVGIEWHLLKDRVLIPYGGLIIKAPRTLGRSVGFLDSERLIFNTQTTLEVWNYRTGERDFSLNIPNVDIIRVLNPRQVLVRAGDDIIEQWDVLADRKLKTYRCVQGAVLMEYALSPDKTRFAVTCAYPGRRGIIELFSVGDERAQSIIRKDYFSPAVQVDNFSNAIYLQKHWRSVEIRSRSGKISKLAPFHSQRIEAIKLSEDGKSAVCTFLKGLAEERSYPQWKLIRSIPAADVERSQSIFLNRRSGDLLLGNTDTTTQWVPNGGTHCFYRRVSDLREAPCLDLYGNRFIAMTCLHGVAVWDVNSEASPEEVVFGHPERRPYNQGSISFRPHSQMLVFSNESGLTKLVDIQHPSPLKTLETGITTSASSPDGSALADAYAGFVEVHMNDQPARRISLQGAVKLQFSHDGGKLLILTKGGLLWLYDNEAKKLVASQHEVTECELSGDGNAIVAITLSTEALMKGTILFRPTSADLRKMSAQKLLQLFRFTDSYFRESGNQALGWTQGGGWSKIQPDGRYYSVAVDYAGKEMAVGLGNKLLLYNVVTRRSTPFKADMKSMYSALEFTEDGKRLLAGSSDAVLEVFSTSSMRSYLRIDQPTGGFRSVDEIAISEGGATVACLNDDGSIYCWHGASANDARSGGNPN